jgi:hypothetical protein
MDRKINWQVEKKSAHEIVQEANMSDRPEYYSGRGPILSDLNSSILEKIYQGIIANHGKKAGENFVLMIADMPKLSATDFLNTLYTLENAGWVWKKEYCSTYGIEIARDANGEYDMVQGMASVVSALFSSGVDETGSIRNSFLNTHLPDSYKTQRTRAVCNGFIDAYGRNG